MAVFSAERDTEQSRSAMPSSHLVARSAAAALATIVENRTRRGSIVRLRQTAAMPQCVKPFDRPGAGKPAVDMR